MGDPNDYTIEPVSVEEANAAPRMMSVSFNGLVEIYDFGVFQKKKGLFRALAPGKSRPPQWFRLRQKLTVETIEHADPYEIGMFIKNSYNNLKEMIDKYEQYGIIKEH